MRALDLRAESIGNPRVERLLEGLFNRLGEGDWRGAASMITDPVLLFGSEVTRETFAANNDASLAGEVTELRELPPSVPFNVAEQVQLFGGELKPSDRVCFATVGIGIQADPITYGLVVDLTDKTKPLVSRIFDPTSFKVFAEAVAETRDQLRRGD